MLTADFQVIADYACEIGENPLWHAEEQRLYWTDIPRGRLYRYDPRLNKHEQCYQGRPVGGFTIQHDGSLLLFMDRGTIASWRDDSLQIVIPEIPSERNSRFNDVIADPRGRVFCGTMSSADSKGKLYRLDPDASIQVVVENVGCSNGMGFSPDHKTFYYTDSFAYEIYAFNYDEETGDLRDRRVFARFAEADGMPDGMTVDSEGALWIAFWDGSHIMRMHRDGKIDQQWKFPARKVSSLTFAGPAYRDLYLTTAGGNTRADDGVLAGSLLRIENIAQGVPEFLSNIQLIRE